VAPRPPLFAAAHHYVGTNPSAAAVGKYLISDKPLTAEQWIKERGLLVDGEAKDVTPPAEEK
jgi:hypothetical protein